MKQPELGTKIADGRVKKNITQKELAELCNIDIRTIQRIEAGEVVPRMYTLKLISAALGLLPLALSVGRPGKELLQPIAVVILGGLISSTLLDQMVTPTLYSLFGRKEAEALNFERIDVRRETSYEPVSR